MISSSANPGIAETLSGANKALGFFGSGGGAGAGSGIGAMQAERVISDNSPKVRKPSLALFPAFIQGPTVL